MSDGVKNCFGWYSDGSVRCCCCDSGTRERCRGHYQRTYELNHAFDALETLPETVARLGAELASKIMRGAR